MDTDDRIRKLANWYYSRMKWDERSNGNKFVKFECGDDKPAEERCRALALDAHSDMLPDDWRYGFICEALSAICDASNLDEIELEADIYNHELTEWVGSHGHRPSYCDDAVSEGLCDGSDMINTLQCGQYMEKREVLGAVLAYLRNEAEEEEQAEEEAEAEREAAEEAAEQE
jgi:hypothetical protein